VPEVSGTVEPSGDSRLRSRPCCTSACSGSVGAPVLAFSKLHTQPARAPVNASRHTSRYLTHDSGSGWFASPFPCDSFFTTSCRFHQRTRPSPFVAVVLAQSAKREYE
jgi:hypothetical protein